MTFVVAAVALGLALLSFQFGLLWWKEPTRCIDWLTGDAFDRVDRADGRAEHGIVVKASGAAIAALFGVSLLISVLGAVLEPVYR